MKPLDLVDAAPWSKVVFTTYSLSLAFFEAVILERLIRGGGRHAMILSDPEGIRAALQEQGARGAGRDYELEPVAGTRGVFHPKISLFSSADDAHLIVGSGNLTFGGWGGNFEQFDHLHPSFAADAFEDAADFFEYLALSDHVRIGSPDKLQPIAEELRRGAANGRRDGKIRILTSLFAPLVTQIAAIADDLGGAISLTIVSPYFDAAGHGVDLLASRLGCESAQVHVHVDGNVRGSAGTNWPGSTRAVAVNVAEPFIGDKRPLHAKCYEIKCRRGRLLVSGSANATPAALQSGNVEAVVVRIQRDAISGWAVAPAKPPVAVPVLEEEASAEPVPGVLTATLSGDGITGMILTGSAKGEATLVVDSGDLEVFRNKVAVDEFGRFAAKTDSLENLGWTGGRLLAIVEQDGKIARGFVAFGAALDIVRRAGAMAPRIFSLLRATETPEEVAAMLSWFYDHPELLAPSVQATYQSKGGEEHASTMVTSAMMNGDLSAGVAGALGSAGASAAWERTIELMLSAFKPDKPEWSDEPDEEDEPDDEADTSIDDEARSLSAARRRRAKGKVRDHFNLLLERILEKGNKGRFANIALSLTLYIIARLRPPVPVARSWLWRAVNGHSRQSLVDDSVALSAAVLLIATAGRDDATIKVRQFLVSHGVDPAALQPHLAGLGEAAALVAPADIGDSFWSEVKNTRCAQEEVRDFLAAAEMGTLQGEYSILMATRHWPRLREVLRNPARIDRLIITTNETACPRCHLGFSVKALDELANTGVTECCRIVLRTVTE